MKYFGIPRVIRCGVIKVLMDIDQCIQYDIDYSEKYNRTNMCISCVIYINSVEANIISNYLKTGLSLTFSHTKVNEYMTTEGVDLVSYSYMLR